MWDINNWEFLNNPVGDYIKSHLVVILIIIFLLVVFLYCIVAVLLNRLNRAMCGKTTCLAWIPVCRTFLLGKLTIHTVVGIILAIGMFLGISITIKTDGIEKVYSILPQNVITPYVITYSAILVALFVYAVIKTKTLEREGKSKEMNIENRKVMSVYDERFSKRINPPENNELPKEQNNTNNNENSFYKSFNSDDSSDVSRNNSQNPGESPLTKLVNNSTNDINNKQNP